MNCRRAFTFIEITIVACIIAILAAIAIPNFLEARVRASVTRSKAELVGLKMAIEAYRLEYREYPRNLTPGISDPRDLVCLTTPVSFIGSLPMDFLTMQEASPSGHRDDAAPIPYRYINGLQVNPEAGLRPTASLAEPSIAPPGFVAGVLWGSGPLILQHPTRPGMKVYYDNLKKNVATAISSSGEIQAMISYDPTNGTTSLGDLYQSLP